MTFPTLSLLFSSSHGGAEFVLSRATGGSVPVTHVGASNAQSYEYPMSETAWPAAAEIRPASRDPPSEMLKMYGIEPLHLRSLG